MAHKHKIVDGLKDAIRYAKGDKRGVRETRYKVLGPGRVVRMCNDCGFNVADGHRGLCAGCDAYREHTGAL